MMVVIVKEELQAVKNNDVDHIKEVLEECGITKDVPFLTATDRNILQSILSYASAVSCRDELGSDLAEELLERAAMKVELFIFVRLVSVAAEIEIDDFSVIPEEIRTALRENEYSDKIAETIDELDNNAFAALLAFLQTGEIKCLDKKFNLPIMREVAKRKTVPECLMFTYIGLCLDKACDEEPHENPFFQALLLDFVLHQLGIDSGSSEE